MLEFDINKPAPNESPELSQEPTPDAKPAPFINPAFGVQEIQATYEMVVGSRQAILTNEFWKGKELMHVAMLLQMLGQMEGQYRSQLEMARQREKAATKKAIDDIKSAGGKVNGNATASSAIH